MSTLQDPTSKTAATPQVARLDSIDALRGFDMFWITGGDVWGTALLTAGSWSFSQAGKEQLQHVPWQGFRFYDLIFPLFLFLVGVVLPFSLSKYRDPANSPTLQLWFRIGRRSILLIFLGLLFNGLLQFDWPNMRYAGVLQRIGICYGLGAVLYVLFSWRWRALLCVLSLVGYWLVLLLIAAPGGMAGDLSPEGNLAGYLDRNFLPGHILAEYYGFGDNEGLLSTWPAVVTVLLGVFAGEVLQSRRDSQQKVLYLLVAAGLCGLSGWLWSFSFPVIKNLWTSSFVLVAAGWSLLLLVVFYGLIDALKWKWLGFAWKVIGVNAITIYLLQEIIDFRKISSFFLGGLGRFSGIWEETVLLTGVLLVQWGLLYLMYRYRIFLRV